MSVSSVDEMWSRKGGGYSSQDGLTVRADFTTAYQIVHSAGDSEDTILAASGVPRIRDTYPGKAGVFCVDTKRQAVGPIMSIVIAQWSGELGWKLDSPLNKPPEINWTNSKSVEPVDTDANGVPLTNVNGDLVDGLTKEVSDFVLTVRRNFASINMYAINNYLDSTNSDTFQGWPAGTGALDTFSAYYVGNELDGYWDVSARVNFRVPYNTVAARAWWHRYRNEGLNERVGVTVSFSGGGGSGALAYAATNTSGGVDSITVTNGGRGYTGLPTVTITSSGGSGATAHVGSVIDGAVQSVTVDTAGTGYNSRLIRAVDGNKQPVTTPVLLKATGEREYAALAATWIERKKKAYSLPYSALGLI